MRPCQVSTLLADLPTGVLVGEWRPAANGATFDVHTPATGEVVATVDDASGEDALAALDAACAVQPAWAATPPIERADLLSAAYQKILDRTDSLATIISAESGKTLAEARAEVAYGAQYLRWYGEEAVRVGGRITDSPDGRSDIVVERRPVGPCLLITPWNFPFAMAARKIAPALAAGNTVIVKPSELTPLATYVLAEVLREAGVPVGVVSVLATTRPAEISEELIGDPRLRKVSFTGSTAVGRLLHRQAAEHFAKLSLELGGDAPLIVFADADVERAVDGILLAKFRNAGQSCVAANRILLEDGIADAVIDRLAERIAEFEVGDGLAAGTEIGAVIDVRARARCAEIVETAVGAGGRVRARSSVPETGTFVPATLVTEVPLECGLVGQEIFGPVALVSRFSTEEQALAVANGSPYGLAGYVFTRDLDRARRVARALNCGMVGVNTGVVSNVAAPFGGIKSSGIGREGGAEGIEEYQNLRYVAVAR